MCNVSLVDSPSISLADQAKGVGGVSWTKEKENDAAQQEVKELQRVMVGIAHYRDSIYCNT